MRWPTRCQCAMAALSSRPARPAHGSPARPPLPLALLSHVARRSPCRARRSRAASGTAGRVANGSAQHLDAGKPPLLWRFWVEAPEKHALSAINLIVNLLVGLDLWRVLAAPRGRQSLTDLRHSSDCRLPVSVALVVYQTACQNKAPPSPLPCRAAWLMASTAGFLMRRSLVTA